MGTKEQEEFEKLLEKAQSRASQTGVESFLKSNAGVFEMGSIFEAETVKGHKNYVIFMFVRDHFVYWFHGDKAKKTPKSQFLKLIDYGDLIPVPPEKRDPEKLSLSVLGLQAMVNGVSFNDYLKVAYGYGEGSQAG